MFNPQAVSQRVDAFRGNPQALMQKYAVSQELIDLLALQQITKEKQDAARQMQLQMAQQQGQQPQPVSQQLESEARQLTQQQIAQKLAPTAQQQAQEQAQEQAQAQQNPQPAQPQGIAANPAPNMQFAEGGIVGYSKGGNEGLESQRAGDQAALRRLATLAKEAGVDLRDALLDVTTAPLRAAAGIADSTVVRLARALGADVGYMSPTFVPKGADASSLTPYADITRAQRAPSSWGGENRADRVPPVQLAPAEAAPPTPETPPVADQGLGSLGAGAGSNTSVNTASVRFNRPPDDPLAARLREGIEANLDAKPDYTQADIYKQEVTDPTKALQAERRAALAQRQQQAQALRDQQLAATEDKTPGWLSYLQHASANIGEGRNAGLRALSAGAVSQRKEKQATAEKRAEIEAKYMALVNQYEDAGFSTKEAEIAAQRDLRGEYGKADTAAAARRDKGMEQAGQEVRDTRARETQIAIAEMQERARVLSEKNANNRATQAEQRELRQLLADMARELGKELETDPIKVRMMTPDQKANNDRIKADLEAVRRRQAELSGVPTGAATSGSGTRMRFDAKGNPIP